MSSKWLEKISLIGETVRLVQLDHSHQKDLTEAVKDGKLWELYFTSAPHPTEVTGYIQKAIDEYHSGSSYPFVIIRKSDNSVVGTTRFMNIDSASKRLEIGTTWYSKSVQRTRVNTESKFLLLQYAFETLNCVAIEFRTHHENFKSQKAIERLGAKKDGILRHHKYDKNGNLRDTYVYSITQPEWLDVKDSLLQKLNKTYESVHIIPANISDAQTLTKFCIRSKNYWGYGEELMDLWREELTISEEYIQKNKVSKYIENEVITGFYAYSLESDTRVKLDFLFIDPEHIRKGIGSFLFNHFLNEIKDLGVTSVVLDADPNAEKFYANLGFKVIGQKPSSIKNRFLSIMEISIS